MDMSVAFDTVDHPGLLKALEKYKEKGAEIVTSNKNKEKRKVNNLKEASHFFRCSQLRLICPHQNSK